MLVRLLRSLLLLSPLMTVALPAIAQGPSFDCAKAESSAEKLVCDDEELTLLDLQLADIYAKALASAEENGWGSTLKAEQRGWVKGRDDCWKADDLRQCVKDEYELRISELQAKFRMAESTGPFFWTCDNNPANVVVITFFETLRPSAIAERGDQSVVLYRAPSGSGSKYEGRNVSFWEHQGEATITWMDETLKCKPRE